MMLRPDGLRLMELMNTSLIRHSQSMVKNFFDKNCIYALIAISRSDQDASAVDFAKSLPDMDFYLLRLA